MNDFRLFQNLHQSCKHWLAGKAAEPASFPLFPARAETTAFFKLSKIRALTWPLGGGIRMFPLFFWFWGVEVAADMAVARKDLRKNNRIRVSIKIFKVKKETNMNHSYSGK